MTVQVPCAIKECPKMARVEHGEFPANDRFVLCHDCQTSVVLDIMLRLEQDEEMIPKTTAAFAQIYNGWMRKRKGATLSHRSGSVTSIKSLGPRIITGAG